MSAAALDRAMGSIAEFYKVTNCGSELLGVFAQKSCNYIRIVRIKISIFFVKKTY
jgi:hypothetical protein